MTAFHEVRLPLRLGFGSSSGIERLTRVTALASGYEQRSTPWAHGRRRYVIGAGLRSLDEAAELMSFFEARCGRLYGFRFRDPTDFKSCKPSAVPSASDQLLGTGDGVRRSFALRKAYGDLARPVTKPVAGTLKVAVNGVPLGAGEFDVDTLNGSLTLNSAPAIGAGIRAGFEFDTPVRFDTDRLDLCLEGFDHLRAVSVPLVEVRV